MNTQNKKKTFKQKVMFQKKQALSYSQVKTTANTQYTQPNECITLKSFRADPSGRAVKGVGLRPHAC